MGIYGGTGRRYLLQGPHAGGEWTLPHFFVAPRECCICQELAVSECPQCYGDPHITAGSTRQYCSVCCQQVTQLPGGNTRSAHRMMGGSGRGGVAGGTVGNGGMTHKSHPLCTLTGAPSPGPELPPPPAAAPAPRALPPASSASPFAPPDYAALCCPLHPDQPLRGICSPWAPP